MISAGQGRYIGMTVRGILMADMARRMEEQEAYLTGSRSGDPAPIEVEGLICGMNEEQLRHYQAAVEERLREDPPGEAADYLPYTLDFAAYRHMLSYVWGLLVLLVIFQGRPSS